MQKTYISINDSDLRIVKHCRKSLLFNKQDVWEKKSRTSCLTLPYKATMTVLKILELVGVYILSHLETINKNGIGVYHNDRLVVLEGANG